jgi:hypothetical protein
MALCSGISLTFKESNIFVLSLSLSLWGRGLPYFPKVKICMPIIEKVMKTRWLQKDEGNMETEQNLT